MEALVYTANALYLMAYFTQDILRLRALTVTAALCLTGYFYLRPEPLMTLVYWNLFFVALNVLQIVRLCAGRRRYLAPPPADERIELSRLVSAANAPSTKSPRPLQARSAMQG